MPKNVVLFSDIQSRLPRDFDFANKDKIVIIQPDRTDAQDKTRMVFKLKSEEYTEGCIVGLVSLHCLYKFSGIKEDGIKIVVDSTGQIIGTLASMPKFKGPDYDMGLDINTRYQACASSSSSSSMRQYWPQSDSFDELNFSSTFSDLTVKIAQPKKLMLSDMFHYHELRYFLSWDRNRLMSQFQDYFEGIIDYRKHLLELEKRFLQYYDLSFDVKEFKQYIQREPGVVDEIYTWGQSIGLNLTNMQQRYRLLLVNCYIDDFTSQLASLLQATPRLRFNFRQVQLPFEIDKSMLSTFVNELEKKGDSLSLLACALLLEGRLGNCIKEANTDYQQKRIHDAISFYLKTTQNSDCPAAKMAQFLLWEIKTCQSYPFAQHRLNRYLITPPAEYCSYYHHFTTHEAPALPDIHSLFKSRFPLFTAPQPEEVTDAETLSTIKLS